jgi:hypothetical protein
MSERVSTDAGFIMSLRTRRKLGRLTAKQIKQVENKLPGFNWDPYGDRLTIEYKVTRAEEIVKELGYFPQLKELIERGDEAVYHARKQNPEVFEHLPKAKQKFFSKEEYRGIALKLCKQNKGSLPTTKKLQGMKKWGLIQTMRKYPELFSDIPKDCEAIKFDTNFARTFKSLRKSYNAGRMSSAQVGAVGNLKKRYHEGNLTSEQIGVIESGFNNWVWRSDRVGSVEDHLPVARKLAKRNKGVLQSHKWLKENGYGGLSLDINRRPGVYAEFTQDTLIKTLDEHLADAKRLEKEYGGLPRTPWLSANDYKGLVHWLNKRRHLFVGIKRLPRESKWSKKSK